jgi:hypothetical protein
MMEDFNCPHCGTHLTTIETPALSKWAGVELEICLNDMCLYFLKSWKVLSHQAGSLVGYRYYHDANGQEGPMAVGSIEAFKDCILTEEEKLYRKEREYREEKEFRDLLEAIEHADEVASSSEGDCAEDHKQLSKWLRQLKKLKYPNRN